MRAPGPALVMPAWPCFQAAQSEVGPCWRWRGGRWSLAVCSGQVFMIPRCASPSGAHPVARWIRLPLKLPIDSCTSYRWQQRPTRRRQPCCGECAELCPGPSSSAWSSYLRSASTIMSNGRSWRSNRPASSSTRLGQHYPQRCCKPVGRAVQCPYLATLGLMRATGMVTSRTATRRPSSHAQTNAPTTAPASASAAAERTGSATPTARPPGEFAMAAP